ncbi:phage portal protein [Streptomyces sp. V2]|uniref:phage portal protein n=1 Tax=Streptomyces sp. V2 TaxID=1424099 RepID=UPI000D66AFFD|nr:phage portal protein [Streptomyces sp. V2]PWG13899.1 phage portal protein [Streptomyces sp. V2]
MAFVVSSGQLATTGVGVTPMFSAMPIPAAPWEYEAIWRTQPQVRTVISFLARNIAQIGIHTFRRVSDTDRERLTDHPLAQLLAEPLPRMTQYRFVERMVSDYALYDDFYGIKLRLNGKLRILPVPPTLIRPAEGNWIAPKYYETPGGRDFAPEEVVHIHGYTPETLTHGTSPIESLRDLLLESRESAKARAAMWKGGARLTGVLVRPPDAPEWGPTEKVRFREMWRSFTQGGGSEGGTPILEDGMEYKPVGFNPQQAQYIEARKLTREEVSAAYFIPPPLIGILDHATYSNIKEQHSHLYQDTLGPYLAMFAQEIQAQILPDMPDAEDVYCEFNIDAKMRGSFEEQAAAASTATGRPWMTVNETRGRNNLPAIEGGDQLITPLNVSEGGLASPRDTASEPDAAPKALARRTQTKAGPDTSGPSELGELRRGFANALQDLTAKESAALVDAGPGSADAVRSWWASGRDGRLARLSGLIADYALRFGLAGARRVLDEFNSSEEGWTEDVMQPWLLAAALHHAQLHDTAGEQAAVEAVEPPPEEGALASVLAAAGGVWATAALTRSQTAATEALSFGGHDAAEASGLSSKRWVTTSSDPRSEHAAMNGQVAPLDGLFSNGLRWPGDGTGDADQTANCRCELTYSKAE